MLHTESASADGTHDVNVRYTPANRIPHFTHVCVCRWTPTPPPEEQAFEAIKASIDAVPAGSKMFLNSGQSFIHPHLESSHPE